MFLRSTLIIDKYLGEKRSTKVEIQLEKPLIEYSRYVLDKGTFNEMLGLAEGITTKLNFKSGELSFVQTGITSQVSDL